MSMNREQELQLQVDGLMLANAELRRKLDEQVGLQRAFDQLCSLHGLHEWKQEQLFAAKQEGYEQGVAAGECSRSAIFERGRSVGLEEGYEQGKQQERQKYWNSEAVDALITEAKQAGRDEVLDELSTFIKWCVSEREVRFVFASMDSRDSFVKMMIGAEKLPSAPIAYTKGE